MPKEAAFAPERMAFSVETGAQIVGVAPRTLWKAVASGELETVKIGRRRLVTREALRDYLARHVESAPTPPRAA